MVVDFSYLQSPGVFIPPVANYLHPLFLFYLFFSNLHLFFGASVTRARATLGATLSHNHTSTRLVGSQTTDSVRYQINQHVVNCAAPGPPPPDQGETSNGLLQDVWWWFLPWPASSSSAINPPPRLVLAHNNDISVSHDIQPLSAFAEYIRFQ
jgi:hypothetical protein